MRLVIALPHSRSWLHSASSSLNEHANTASAYHLRALMLRVKARHGLYFLHVLGSLLPSILTSRPVRTEILDRMYLSITASLMLSRQHLRVFICSTILNLHIRFDSHSCWPNIQPSLPQICARVETTAEQ